MPPALRAKVRKRIQDQERAEDEEYAQLMNAPSYQLNIFCRNRTVPIEVKAWFTIDVVKAKIRNQEGIPMNTFNLVCLSHGGQPLDGGKELGELMLQDNAILHVIEIKTTRSRCSL